MILFLIFLIYCQVSLALILTPMISEKLRSLISVDKVDAKAVVTCLNELKTNGMLNIWNSTIITLGVATSKDVQFLSRTSFSTPDYYNFVLRNARSKADLSISPKLIIIGIIGVLFSSLLLPSLSLPSSLKNTIGVIGILLPFVLAFFGAANPIRNRSLKSLPNYTESFDRICCHEAGHFLLGYLCGIPILTYDTSGEVDASLTVEMPTLELTKTIGSILVISLGGVVAESLRFGNANGGNADMSVALSVLNEWRMILKQSSYSSQVLRGSNDDYLRWAVAKALLLLRLHRDVLDELTTAMREQKSVVECMWLIEMAALRPSQPTQILIK